MKRLSQLPKSRQLFGGTMVERARRTACSDSTRSCPPLKHSFKTGFNVGSPALRGKARAGLRCPPLSFRDLPRRARHGPGYWARSNASSQFTVASAPASPPPRGLSALGRCRSARPLVPLSCLCLAWGAPSQPVAPSAPRSPQKDALFVSRPRLRPLFGAFGSQSFVGCACWFPPVRFLADASKKH